MILNKRLGLLLLIVVSLIASPSCSSPAYPEFEKIKNVKILALKADMVRVGAKLLIKNPNIVGGTVINSDIDITLLDKHQANVKQIESIEIPAGNTFELPIEFQFSPKKIWKDDLMGSALNILGNKKIKTHIVGTVTVDFAGLGFDIPIDVVRDIPLKRKKKNQKRKKKQ